MRCNALRCDCYAAFRFRSRFAGRLYLCIFCNVKMCSEMNNHVDTQEWKVNNRFAVSRIVVLLMESYPNYPSSGMLSLPRLCKKGKCWEQPPQIFCMCPETLPLPSVLLRETRRRAGIETLFLVVQESLRKNHVQQSC